MASKKTVKTTTRILTSGMRASKVKILNGEIQEVYNNATNAWEKYDHGTSYADKRYEIRQPPTAGTVGSSAEYDRLMGMSNDEFNKEIGSLSDIYFEGMMRRSGLSNWERNEIRGRRAGVVQQQQPETSNIDKSDKLPKEESPNLDNSILSVPTNTGTEDSIQPIHNDQDSIQDIPNVDIPNVDIPNVDIPKVDIPKVDIPKVDIPKVDIPKVDIHEPEISKSDDITNTNIVTSPDGQALADIPKVDIPKVDIPKVDIPKVDIPKIESAAINNDVVTSPSGPVPTYAPNEEQTNIKSEPPKVAILREVPKIQTSKDIQKEVQEMPIPGVQGKLLDRLNKAIGDRVNETNIDLTKTVNIESQKAEIPKDVPKVENIQKNTKKETLNIKSKEKKPIKEAKRTMADDELIIQPSEERKFEEWLKKHRFNENVEKMAEIAEKNQKEIEGVKGDIGGVKGDIGDVRGDIGDVRGEIGGVKEEIGGVKGDIKGLEERLQDKLGLMKRPVSEELGEICSGVECIKGDIKRSQESQQMLESKMNQRFEQLAEKLHSLEEPTFVCDNCGSDSIKPLSSFCPNCGSPIYEWNDENGQPVKGWAPFWKRSGRQSV